MARKLPILLRRGPLSGEVFAIHNYTWGVADSKPYVKVATDGKQSVQADYDALVLEELVGEHAPHIIPILSAMVSYSDEMPPDHRLELRAFLKAFKDMADRFNARNNVTPEDQSEVSHV